MEELYINAAVLISFLIYLIIYKYSAVSKVLLGIWVFSSVCSIIYANAFFNGKVTIAPAALLYFDACIFIYLFPLCKNFKVQNIRISKRIVKNIELFLFIVGILSLPPFIEHCVQFFNTFTQPASGIVDIYDIKMEKGHGNITPWLDPFSYLLNNYLGKLGKLGLFLLFVIFTQKKRIKTTDFLIYLIAILLPVIHDLNTSGRSSFTFFTISALVLYFLFRRSIIVKIQKSIYVSLLLIFVVGISAIIIITLLRSDSYEQESALVWSSLYFGEGPLKFMRDVWDMKMTTQGDTSFSYIKSFLGFDTFKDLLERRLYWNQAKTGVDPVRFYTFIGDWMLDLGPLLNICFITTLSFFVNKFLKKNKKGLIGLFLLFQYIYIFATGYTYFSLKVYFSQSTVFIGLLFIWILSHVDLDLQKKTFNPLTIRK